MNFNDNPEELKREEQAVLDALIDKMDHVLDSLDAKMQEYVAEAKDANISINPDLYLSRLMAQNGIKNTNENRNRFLQARDELYHTRLLLLCEYGGKQTIDEIKVGLHSCMYHEEQFITAWTMPVCRHYILNNPSLKFESIVPGKFGETYHANYTLLVKNEVKLRFTRVVKAMNLYPGIFDDKTLKMIKGTGFLSDAYLDKMIKQFNSDKYTSDNTAKIISDEFLQELLERRSSPEFKNIIFSIQEKQGEIIQAPLERNMIVQGCAGSGKSMIMMHRLPILLYDHPNSLIRTNVYIITPSEMYVQMAENMRNQLEISDINMGTLNQYYDYCIAKYPGHTSGEYGKIRHSTKISTAKESYIYSEKCRSDIRNYYRQLVQETEISLEKAEDILELKLNNIKADESKPYYQVISDRMASIQRTLTENNKVLDKYFHEIIAVLDALRELRALLKGRRDLIIRMIIKKRSDYEDIILHGAKIIDRLDPEENTKAIHNRNKAIKDARQNLSDLNDMIAYVENDTDYFESLCGLSRRIETILTPFGNIKSEGHQNSTKEKYDAIDGIGQLVDGWYAVSWDSSRIEEKYSDYVRPLGEKISQLNQLVAVLQGINDKYLDYNYYCEIERIRDLGAKINRIAIRNAYDMVMDNIGVSRPEKESRPAVKCSPYAYLLAIYLFRGEPTYARESLLAIDESQGVAPEELRLLKDVNGDSVILNLYGDIHQHIEGTKGIESWDEYRDIIDFDIYEIQENYRNASQITEYCNRKFGMHMNVINTPGKGVHELLTEEEFREEMITQLMDTQRAGLAAILVANDAEARYLLGKFAAYEQKFNDMTGEDFSMHRTRWNIIHIDDVKGLEFSSVIVLSGRMSRNQQYIAYTRALDDLYIYPNIIDVSAYEKKTRQRKDHTDFEEKWPEQEIINSVRDEHILSGSLVKAEVKNHKGSEVRAFFESKGLNVIDKRDEGGRLWVIGEKTNIRIFVNEAISKFKISGKYISSKESLNKPGWCTKTDK